MLSAAAREFPLARAPMPIGEHGTIHLTDKGSGQWKASCRFRDYDGVHQLTRATPPHITDDPDGALAKAELLREIHHRRYLLGLDDLANRQRIPFSPHGCFVYLLWGNDRQRPLYIGQTSNVLQRLGYHVQERGRQIRDVEIIPCDSEADMMRLERVLISTLGPVWNTTHNAMFRRIQPDPIVDEN